MGVPMIMGTWEPAVGTRLEARIRVNLGREKRKTKEQNCLIPSGSIKQTITTTMKQNQNS